MYGRSSFGGNPERNVMRKLDNERRGDRIAETAKRVLTGHSKFAKVLQLAAISPREALNADEPVYSEEEIARDERYVEDMKQRFAAEAQHRLPNGLSKEVIKCLAERLEYEVIRGVNKDGWWSTWKARKTSEYDDIRNGVDVVLKTDEESPQGYFGLALDVSFSHDLQKKFQRIKEEILRFDGEQHTLGEVKYFSSHNGGHYQKLTHLPRIVGALDLKVLEDLTRSSDGALNLKVLEDPTRSSDLKDNIAQHLLLTQAQKQLRLFHQFAERRKPAAAEYIGHGLGLVEQLAIELDSEKRIQQSEYIKNRDMDRALANGLMLFR